MLTRMRIWLPDDPGVLGAVAAEIGAAKGNVVGLEVLERESGVAIDELVVELPDDPGAIDAVCRGVRLVPGVGVEEVKELLTAAQDREESVLAAATAILQGATVTAALNALLGQLNSLFDLDWLALADLTLERFIEVHGDVPSAPWVVAFAAGSRSGADPANDTIGSGVFIEAVPDTELTVCGGRTIPLRRRERREIAMLVTVASRFIDALGWNEHAAVRPT
jgi:hypothetical protein